jgi:hypothetical protein
VLWEQLSIGSPVDSEAHQLQISFDASSRIRPERFLWLRSNQVVIRIRRINDWRCCRWSGQRSKRGSQAHKLRCITHFRPW